MFDNYNFTVTERFIRYVKIDTQSDPESSAVPSTEKQKDLGRLLVKELLEMGIADAHLDDKGYVYATLPSNTDKNVPVICFCSHMDTSPDCSGKDVIPQLHANYNGGNIIIADGVVLSPTDHPDLLNQQGNTIITASGNTLLGADNKAGVAEIMDAVHFLVKHPEIKHGTIKILFTPDEEIGRGADHADLQKVGAFAGYTLDGESRGSLENENFSADGVTLTIKGISAHPGFAKGKMQSALKIAAEIIDQLPKERLSPETTEKREGFVHPVSIKGNIDECTVQFIIRDFETGLLKVHEDELEQIVGTVMNKYPACSYQFKVTEQYRNMKEILDQHPRITEYAIQAIQRAGMQVKLEGIRGGTDGSRFSYMGLPCPNLFAGEHAFHSVYEWVSKEDMEKAVEMVVHLCMIWEEKSN
jgi:tripeptide aminopeptidase